MFTMGVPKNWSRRLDFERMSVKRQKEEVECLFCKILMDSGLYMKNMLFKAAHFLRVSA